MARAGSQGPGRLPPQLGVCIFREKGTDGIAQLGVGRNASVFEVMLPEQLPKKNTTWWISLNWKEMCKRGMSADYALRRPEFFRLSMPGILAELGMRCADDEEKLKCLAQVFHQAFDCGQRMFGWDRPPRNTLYSGVSMELSRGGLRERQREVIPPGGEYPFTEARQHNTYCYGHGRRPGESRTFTTLRLQRFAHALRILGSPLPLPQATWTHHTLRGNKYTELLEEIRELGARKPLLAEIGLAGFADPQMAGLYAHGSGAETTPAKTRMGHQRDDPNLRTWVVGQELEALLKAGAEIDLGKTIMLCHAAYPKQPQVEDIIRMLQDKAEQEGEDDFFNPYVLTDKERMEYAVGLFMENFWVGAACVSAGMVKGSPLEIWMFAFDRICSLDSAFRVSAQPHFHVSGYSYGRAWVNISQEDPEGLGQEIDMGEHPEVQEQMAVAAAQCKMVPPVLPDGKQNPKIVHCARQLFDAAYKEGASRDEQTTATETALCLLGERGKLLGMEEAA